MKKKIAALFLGLAMMISLTGCTIGSAYSNVMTVDGTDVWSGLYLMQQLRAYSTAEGLVDDADKDVLKQKVEGQSASSWIQQKAEEYCRRYVAVANLAREYGVVLPEDARTEIESSLTYWSYLEDYYTRNGVSLDTWTYYLENSYLDDALFTHLYGEDGEFAWTDAELKAGYEEKYAQINALYIPTTTVAGEDGEASVDMTEAVTEIAQRMVAQLEAGAALAEVAQSDELAQIYTLLGREYDADAAAEYPYTSYIDYEATWYTESWLEELRGQSVGDVGLYVSDAEDEEATTTVFVYQKLETFEDDAAFAEMRDTVLDALCYEEYEEWLAEVYNGYTVKKVFLATWYYRPSNIE